MYYMKFFLILLNCFSTGFIVNNLHSGYMSNNLQQKNLIKMNNNNKFPLKQEYYEYLLKYKKIEIQNNDNNLLRGSRIDEFEYYSNLRKERYLIFEKNYYNIQEFNNKNEDIKLEINHFADQCYYSNPEDFPDKNNFVDINNDLINFDIVSNNHINKFSKIFKNPVNSLTQYLKIPKQINWIDYVSNTKNQGNCGSCWAFSSTGAIESLMRINNYTIDRLSEQELVDFSDENSGCNGGLMHRAFNYCIENNGLVSEKDYPYKEEENNISFTKDYFSKLSKVIGSNISKYDFIIPNSKTDMMISLQTGPIAIAIDASSLLFRFYRQGIIDVPNNFSNNINHAVLLIGYTINSNESYWTIQNSWGTDWGENGFARIKIRDGKGVLLSQTYGIYPLL